MARLRPLLLLLCLVAVGAAARSAYDLGPVDAAMRELVARHQLAGAALRLDKDGSVVMRRSYGNYTGQERLPIASASKWLSALALARLVERGDLDWDDRIGDYLADAPAATRAITVAQLFSHTSGIAFADAPCLADRFTSLDACARQILAMPLVATPGTRFAYGGNSMQVAGRLAELASGQVWDDLFLAEVVAPLGLVATDWAGGSLVGGYVRVGNPRIAGGARSSLDDYGRVVSMLRAGGRHGTQSYLSAETLATMARDHSAGTTILYSPFPESHGYGLGQWREAVDAQGAATRVSSPGAFGFTPWVDWQVGVAGVFVSLDQWSRLRGDLFALVAVVGEQLQDRRALPRPPPEPRRQGRRRLDGLRPDL